MYMLTELMADNDHGRLPADTEVRVGANDDLVSALGERWLSLAIHFATAATFALKEIDAGSGAWNGWSVGVACIFGEPSAAT